MDLVNTFSVRGTTFRRSHLALVAPGDLVCLEPEPTNPYDANAIQVLAYTKHGMVHIGYVPFELCAAVKRLLNWKRNGPGLWGAKIASINGDRVIVEFRSDILVGRQASVGV